MGALKLSFLALIVCGLSITSAQQPGTVGESDKPRQEDENQLQIDTSQRYMVLGTKRLDTLRRELDQASAAGYRVTQGDPEARVLLLEKGLGSCQYRIVNHLNDELHAALADGFRPVPTAFGGGVLVMEKCEGDAATHDYVLLHTFRVGTLQQELNETAGRGYELAAMDRNCGAQVLMAKRSPSAAMTSDRYLALDIKFSSISTLQRKISDAAAEGYAVAGFSAGRCGPTVIMEKSGRMHEYLVLSTLRISSLNKKVSEAAARSFRAVPNSLVAWYGGYSIGQPIVIMEKVAPPEPFTYELVEVDRERLARLGREKAEIIGFVPGCCGPVVWLRNASTPSAGPETKSEAQN
jgi:hypothetical protein